MNTQKLSRTHFSATTQCSLHDAAFEQPPSHAPSPNNSRARQDSWQHVGRVARTIESAGLRQRPSILIDPCVEATNATATHITADDYVQSLRLATELPRQSHAKPRYIRITLLALIAWLVMLTLAVAAHATGASAPLRSLVQLHTISEPHDCALDVNSALVNDEAYVVQWRPATQTAYLSARSALAHDASSGAAKALIPVAGPSTLRLDAAGRAILRIGFMATPSVIAQFGIARLTADSQAAIMLGNEHFAQLGVGVAFERAVLDAYGGQIDEASDSLSVIHGKATARAYYQQYFVEGNYEKLISFRARHQLNLAVLLASPVKTGGVAGLADRGSVSFEWSSFLIAMNPAFSASVTTLYAEALTHEIGHAMGLRHGISQDLATSGADKDAAAVLAYQLSMNYAYGVGSVSTDASGAGVFSMMALGLFPNPTQFPATTPVFIRRFSDPTARRTV